MVPEQRCNFGERTKVRGSWSLEPSINICMGVPTDFSHEYLKLLKGPISVLKVRRGTPNKSFIPLIAFTPLTHKYYIHVYICFQTFYNVNIIDILTGRREWKTTQWYPVEIYSVCVGFDEIIAFLANNRCENRQKTGENLMKKWRNYGDEQ